VTDLTNPQTGELSLDALRWHGLTPIPRKERSMSSASATGTRTCGSTQVYHGSKPCLACSDWCHSAVFCSDCQGGLHCVDAAGQRIGPHIGLAA
jgi:hypothetical protein